MGEDHVIFPVLVTKFHCLVRSEVSTAPFNYTDLPSLDTLSLAWIQMIDTGDCRDLATEKPKTPKPQYPQLNEKVVV